MLYESRTRFPCTSPPLAAIVLASIAAGGVGTLSGLCSCLATAGTVFATGSAGGGFKLMYSDVHNAINKNVLSPSAHIACAPPWLYVSRFFRRSISPIVAVTND